MKDLFEYALQDVSDSDMVGITTKNQVNQNDKQLGISFRRKNQLSGDVIWGVFEKVSQANSRFNASDTCRNCEFGQSARRFLKARDQEHEQTSLCHGSSQVKYRGGEGRRKLSCSRFNNDCQSR